MNYIEKTKNWIQSFIIHYNLCPFAKKPFNQDRIRYRLYEGRDLSELMEILQQELLHLESTDRKVTETSILIFPNVLIDFSAYLDYLELANDLIFALHLEDLFQIASFHPDYQFDGTAENDVTNYTNRSPFPLFHLIREASITEALTHFEAPEKIPERNKLLMEQLKEKLLNNDFQ
jgi:hypothetical protein